jgi:hypothetical protein
MGKVHVYFLIIAALISLLFHLFLLNAAVQFTIKIGLFENPVAEELFRIKTVERPRRNLGQRPELSPDELVSLERQDETGRSKADLEDRRRMLAQRGLISFDASDAEINEALKKLFEGETVEPDTRVEPDLSAGETIAQEVIAIEESVAGERINVPTRTITRSADRGWATSDVYVPDEGASPGDVLKAIAGARGGRDAAEADDAGEFGPHAESLVEQGGVIPTIIKPPEAVTPVDVEAAELEDVVAEPATLLRKYPALDDLLAVRMLTYHEPGDPEGYFMVVVEPRRDRSEFDIIAKDVVFVVDSSSSIGQPKLERYVEGLQRCVAALNPRDRFDIVEFKTEPRRMSDGLVPVTKARLRTARYFLDSLVSSGNTDVYSAVQGLVGTRPDPNRPYLIFLVTDGRANRGVVENRNIINKVAEINENRAAVYSFAGGTKFNEYLLDLLSYRNKGESRFERSERAIADSLFTFYDQVRDPILLNLRYQVGAVSEPEVYPKVLPDFFLKSRITICGRYRDEEEFSMQILGQVNGTTKEFIFKQSFDQPDNGDARVARQWAFHKIYHLIGQMVAHGEDTATIRAIRALGKKHGIQTPYYE